MNTQADIISIILPTYNGSRFIAQSIESVLQQSYQNWELIIVNDCSTDKTPEIINHYAALDNRIIIVNNEINKRLPKSLNIGFAKAKGKYLTWTSDDNYYLENALEDMAACLDKHPETAMVYADMRIINEDGKFIKNTSNSISAESIVKTNPCGACFLYRKSAAEKVGGYDEDNFLVEDYDYWLRMFLAGSILHLNKILYAYRTQPGSLTAKRKTDILQKRKELCSKYVKLYAQTYPQLQSLADEITALETYLQRQDLSGFAELKKKVAAKDIYKYMRVEYKISANDFVLKTILKLGLLARFRSLFY